MEYLDRMKELHEEFIEKCINKKNDVDEECIPNCDVGKCANDNGCGNKCQCEAGWSCNTFNGKMIPGICVQFPDK